MIDRSARVNLLRELLRGRMVNGSDWSRLPSEPELCARFRESRNVVRDALTLLKQEGLIERRQGRGTFAMISRPAHLGARMYFVGDDLEASTSSFETLAIEPMAAPADVADRLEVLPGSTLVSVQRRTWINRIPFSLQTSLLPISLGSWLLDQPPTGEWYAELEAAGLRLGGADQVFEATIADPYVSELLLVEPGAPLLLFERLLLLDDGRPVELGFVRCRGDRLAVQVLAERAEPNDASPAANEATFTRRSSGHRAASNREEEMSA